MQTEKSHPEGKRIMPETRFTEFPASSVGISRYASETDDCAAYQRSAICDEFGESAGCSFLIGKCCKRLKY